MQGGKLKKLKAIKTCFSYVESDEEWQERKKAHFKMIHQEVIKADALTLIPLVAYLLKNSRLDLRQHYKGLSLEALAEIELLNRYPIWRRRKE